jgi:hypothetical protein
MIRQICKERKGKNNTKLMQKFKMAMTSIQWILQLCNIPRSWPINWKVKVYNMQQTVQIKLNMCGKIDHTCFLTARKKYYREKEKYTIRYCSVK